MVLKTIFHLVAQGRIFNNKLYTFMNKQALADFVHGRVGGTKVAAEELVNGIIDEIVSTLKKGDEVSIAGLGIFSVKDRPARNARNPKTGETVKVPKTRVPKFRAAKALKDAVAK
jgi:DNA-binding protein HU-beta